MTAEAVYVFTVARTPFGRFGGALARYDPGVLAGLTIDEVLRRASVPPGTIDCVFAGVGMISGALLTAARQAVLRSALPDHTPSVGLDRACCSGLSAIAAGWQEIRAGQIKSAICGGFDVLSATPYLQPRLPGATSGNFTVGDPLALHSPFSDTSIASYTSKEALRNGIDRMHQDEWALASHERYFAADAQGYFQFERFPVEARPALRTLSCALVTTDESPRSDSSLEKLSSLATVRDSATITAGNAPGLSDGAAFVLLGSEAFGVELGLRPLAEIVTHARVAESPTSGTRTPALAINRVLSRGERTMKDLGLLEINEAFAATPLVSTLVLSEGNTAAVKSLRARTNVHGGAVAIGHPLGASGCRLVITLVNGLWRRGGGLGAAAICGGFGQGEAILLRTCE